MIKHIVFFRLKENSEDAEKNENKRALADIFRPLENLPTVSEYSVAVNFSESPSAWDVVIDSSFNSVHDLKLYQVSLEHQTAIKKAGKFKKDKAVIDYDSNLIKK